MTRTVFFDVNETLSDLSQVTDALVEIGADAGLVQTWFAGTLRDAFALNLTSGPAPFEVVARNVLLGLLNQQEALTLDVQSAADDVMAAFASLPVHPDIPAGVRQLAADGCRLVCLSNGSVSNTEALLERAGIQEHFDLVLSVDDAGAWKPHRRAYDYALGSSGTSVSDAVMVAVHPWDLHGAHEVGLQTVFLDRTGTPWPDMFHRPDHHVRALSQLRLP